MPRRSSKSLLRVRTSATGTMTGLPYLFRISGAGLRSPRIRVRGTNFAGASSRWARVSASSGQVIRSSGFALALSLTMRRLDQGKSQRSRRTSPSSRRRLSQLPGSRRYRRSRDVPAKVQDGQTVLIIGAGGAVGSFAVQIAKAFARACQRSVQHVEGRPRARPSALTQSSTTRVTTSRRPGEHYDVIVDTAGNRPSAVSAAPRPDFERYPRDRRRRRRRAMARSSSSHRPRAHGLTVREAEPPHVRDERETGGSRLLMGLIEAGKERPLSARRSP